VAFIVAAAASWIAAIAFLRADRSGIASRDERLGWATGLGAGALLLICVSRILVVIFFSDLGASSGLTTGFGIDAAGQFIAVGAFVVAAVGFFASARRVSADLRLGRDLLLGIAAAVFSSGYLLVGIGDLVVAAALSKNGFDGSTIADGWLSTVQDFAFAAAAACVSIAFLITRSAQSGAEVVRATPT